MRFHLGGRTLVLLSAIQLQCFPTITDAFHLTPLSLSLNLRGRISPASKKCMPNRQFCDERSRVADDFTLHSQTVPAVNDDIKLPWYSKIGRIKVKGLDFNIPIGAMFFTSVLGWALALYPAMMLSYLYCLKFDSKRKRLMDWIVHLWAKVAMLTVTYKPTVKGIENLPPASEAVMYIPNHCSFLDIFTLSGFLPRPLKYVSKMDILGIPLIGWAMRLSGHIGIERTDKRSQLQTFKETVQSLQDGNSIVTFAEGTRSSTGRLDAFKKGPIKMAIKAGVRIVPISIANVHRWMPDSALAPLALPRNVVVTVHPPIDPAAAGGEDAALAAVFAAVDSGLPQFQRADPALLAAGGASRGAASGDAKE